MKWLFHLRNFPKHLIMLEALQNGFDGTVLGVVGFERPLECNGVILFGIGGESRAAFAAYQQQKTPLVFIDKGYVRGGKYWRVAINAFQPTRYLIRAAHPDDRLEQLNLSLQPSGPRGEYIILDGASHKYTEWCGLGNWYMWAARMVNRIREHSNKPIVYRPRPTLHGRPPEPIKGTELSRRELSEDFARAYCVVTHGGNLGFDAVVAGIPVFVIGDSIARPLAQTQWDRLEQLRIPSAAERRQWLANVAYQQWTLPELSDGTAWQHIKNKL